VIILDTNVLSECLKPAPDARVMAWIAAQPSGSLFTTAVVEAEILYGIRLLADGARKAALASAVRAIFAVDLAGRVIPFDRDCAEVFAEIAASRKISGQPISQFDAMIAAATRSRGATLATRNQRDFADCGIDLIDPWVQGK
jgi:predicted nucleic acid-binding protein